jgi:hypothetical protein
MMVEATNRAITVFFIVLPCDPTDGATYQLRRTASKADISVVGFHAEE